jgi:hypothetical protein
MFPLLHLISVGESHPFSFKSWQMQQSQYATISICEGFLISGGRMQPRGKRANCEVNHWQIKYKIIDFLN